MELNCNKVDFNFYKQIYMSYPEIGDDGEVNPCYFFMRELEHCFHSNLYGSSRCQTQREDFL